MGWRCNNCGNAEFFTEINKVETAITQDKASTKAIKLVNKYAENPLLGVTCNICQSSNIKWIDIQSHDYSHLFQQDSYVTENHEINTMVFELTNKCDIDDIYYSTGDEKELAYTLVKRIVDENLKMKRPIRNFEFGWDKNNPLLHSQIKQIIGLFDNFECGINILTNGKNFIKYAENLNLTNKLTFTFFLDHSDKDENDRIMGEGVFLNTLKAFDYLKRKNIKYNIYMRLSKLNYNNIGDMHELAKINDVNTFIPIEIYPLGKVEEDLCMDDDMKSKALRKINELGLNKSIHFSPALLNVDCTYNRSQRLFLDVYGNLSFCHFLRSLPNSRISDTSNLSLLEIIQRNNKARSGFLRNKERLFGKWEKPRETASPCSYCLHAFGLNKRW